MVVLNIKKYSSEYKQWKKRNDNKKLRNRINAKKNKHHCQKRKINKTILPYKTFKPPEIFSILKNPKNTIKFFNDMIDIIMRISKVKNNKHIHLLEIDMTEVVNITGDALMYLLTVMRNTKIQQNKKIIWRGNFPKNEKINKYLKASGFLKYMKTAEQNLIHSDENFEIQCGKLMQGDIAKRICEFTNSKLNTDKIYSKFLYRMLTELMTNTKDHAYNRKSTFDYYWYIFIENNQNKIKYTFMDNGSGIPKTVLKKFKDRIIEILHLDKEYKYIESALMGEFRTETKEGHRGTGLPDIYNISEREDISNLTIISNCAYYSKAQNSYDMEKPLEGTVLYWEINKMKGDKINEY